MAQGRPAGLMEVEAFLLPVSDVFINQVDAQPIFFQFFPEITGDGESANFEDVGGDVLGRAEPFSIYKNGNAREFSLKATFVATDRKHDEYWVQRQVMRIRALTKPVYDREDIFTTNSGTYFGPPLVLFTAGRHYINLPVVVKAVTYNVVEGSMITTVDALPQAVELEISVKTNYPYGYVPGYFNYLNLYPDRNYDPEYINPREMSFGGEFPTMPADVNQILVDAEATGIPAVQSNRVFAEYDSLTKEKQKLVDGWNKLNGTKLKVVVDRAGNFSLVG